MIDYLDDIFGPAGPIAARVGPGYETREGQITLARAFEAGIAGARIVLGEGPTGAGKGLAYLVPAIRSVRERGHRVVVSTAGIALQEQLLRKDLPTLQRALPWRFSFAALKGRGNYACGREWARNNDRLMSMVRAGGERGKQAHQVDAWAYSQFCNPSLFTGDRTSFDYVPQPEVWRLVSCRA